MDGKLTDEDEGREGKQDKDDVSGDESDRSGSGRDNWFDQDTPADVKAADPEQEGLSDDSEGVWKDGEPGVVVVLDGSGKVDSGSDDSEGAWKDGEPGVVVVMDGKADADSDDDKVDSEEVREKGGGIAAVAAVSNWQ